jgi:hypothetical protein
MPQYLWALIAMSMISFGVARMASLIFWISCPGSDRARLPRAPARHEFGGLHQLVECRPQRRDAGGRHGAVNEGSAADRGAA